MSEFTFDISKMSVSGAIFDIVKLLDVSKNVISKYTKEEYHRKVCEDILSKEYEGSFLEFVKQLSGGEYLSEDDAQKILEILAKYDVKATFFPNWKEGNEELYKKIADGGHALGNHTASHDWKSVYSSLDGFINEVETLNDKIEAATGTRPTLFRFPGGSNNTIHRNYNKNIISPAIDYLNQKGITYIDWNVDSGDASSQTPLAPEKLTKNVLDTALRQSVILMHDTNAKPTTVEALPAIIEGLKERGYKFDVLSPDSNDSKVQFVKS